MPKGTYYFDNGRGGLTEVPVEADDKGNLTRLDEAGKPEAAPFCTGAKTSDEPADGKFVPDGGKKPDKSAKH